MRRTTSATLAAALLVAAGAVATTGAVQASGNGPGQHHGHHGHHGHGKSLTVSMYDVAENRVGKVRMRQRGGVIEVTGTVGSLTPGFHGFHVHTTGICDPAAPNGPFTSAGGHYVGSGGSHGDHDGDLPSLLADQDGAARIWFTTDRFTLAELKTKVEISRCFVDRCIERYVDGTCTAQEAAMAKYWTTDLLSEVTDVGLQLHGGYGYTTEYAIGQAWVDARIGRIYAGTNEIMKELIGKTMGL